MKTGIKQSIGLAMICCLVAGTLFAAEEEAKKKHGRSFAGAGEIKAYHAKQMKLRREFKKERHEGAEAHRESLKDMKPAEALPAIISFREGEFVKTKSFMSGLHEDMVANAKEVMAKHEVPADKQAAMLEKMEGRRAKEVAKHEEMHKTLIAALEGLKGQDDLTLQKIKSTISDAMPKHDRKHRKKDGKKREKKDEDK